MEPSELPTETETDFEGDPTISKVANQLLRHMGVPSNHEDLNVLRDCAKQLLEVQARKVLQVPGR